MSRLLGLTFFGVFIATSALSQISESKMQPVASTVMRLSRALDGFVAGNDKANKLGGVDLLRAAADHDTALLSELEELFVDARAEGDNSSVLVCTADKRAALLEDAGCSAKVDAPYWRQSRQPDCAFKLDLEKICMP